MLQLLTRPRTALALLAAALVGLALLACGGADPTATAAPAPTATPQPTPAPTATMPPPPTATSAPAPTATPRPTPTTRPTDRPQPTPPPAPTDPPPTDPGMGMRPPALAPYQGTGYTIMVPEGWDEQAPSIPETVYQTVNENGVVASLTEVSLPPGLETGEEAADALMRFVEGGSLWDFQVIEQSREQQVSDNGVPAEFILYITSNSSHLVAVLVPSVTDVGLIAVYQIPFGDDLVFATASVTAENSFRSLSIDE